MLTPLHHSRQRSGLLLFGNINVTGALENNRKRKRGGKAANTTSYKVVTESGEAAYVNRGMLDRILTGLEDAGRVIRIPVPPKVDGHGPAGVRDVPVGTEAPVV